jgi:proline dehydrogenase
VTCSSFADSSLRAAYNRRAVGLLDRAIVQTLPLVPRRVVRRVSSRYIAGPTLDDARGAIAKLNARGQMATIDVLGEEVTSPEAAVTIAGQYHDALEAIRTDRLEANVSVKLTALGLEIDLDLCRSLLAKVVADAADHGTFVRIDMEHSAVTDDTLRLYRELREVGRDNVGIVLQSRLHRSLADAAKWLRRYLDERSATLKNFADVVRSLERRQVDD